MKDALLPIVLYQRLRLGMVDIQTFLNGIRMVIITQDQLISAMITDAILYRLSVKDMEGFPALRTRSSSAHTLNDMIIGNLHIDREIDP